MALGGAQRLLLDQAAWLSEHGVRVSAAFFYDKQGLSEIWKREAQFPVLTLSKIKATEGLLAKTAGLATAFVSLWGVLRRGRFDVVEAFTYDSNLLALPLAWLAGVPVRIATHHGIIEGFPGILESLHTVIINSGIANKIVNVSRKVMQQAAASGIRLENMTVIPNGIPATRTSAGARPKMRASLGLSDEDILLISVGRLVYQKGHEYLIAAMPQVIRESPAVRAVVCGEGPLRAQLEAQIKRLEVSESIRLLGNQRHISSYLAAADIFVLPSRWEGLPVALLEAMDAALPVVATRVEGVEEAIEDGAQGILVPPEDTRRLSEAICRLIGRPAERQRMGLAGRATVRDAYTIEIMSEKYLALMQSLLQRAGS